MMLNNNEVFALSDYLRHQLAVEYPMEQYFIEKAATALEDLANERAELKHQIQLLTTPIIDKTNQVSENDRNK
jgi:cell division protein FtsB